MREKINIFLWLVVFAYLFYAMAVEGPTPKLLLLTAAAVLAAIVEIIGERRRRR